MSLGAIPGSRALHEAPSCTGSSPSGFDPERFELVAEGCANIIERTKDYAISGTVCEDVERLERFHDALAHEVINLAGMLRTAMQALAAAGFARDVKQARPEGRQSGDAKQRNAQGPAHD